MKTNDISLFHFCPINDYLFENLEKQQLSAASLGLLNDPAEENFQVTLSGDVQFWNKIIDNFSRSLFYAYSTLYFNHFDNVKLTEVLVPRLSSDIFENDHLYKLFNEFVESQDTNTPPNSYKKGYVYLRKQLSNSLLSHKIHLNELEFIFLLIVEYLIILFEDFFEQKKINTKTIPIFFLLLGKERELKEDYYKKEFVIIQEKIIKLFSNEHNELYLSALEIFSKIYSFLDSNDSKTFESPYSKIAYENVLFIISKFAKEFCHKLKNLMFPRAYSLSFTKNKSLSNPVMWSHYSDNHRGICLEFDKKEVENEIRKHFNTPSKKSKILDINYREERKSYEFSSNLWNLDPWIRRHFWSSDIDSDNKYPHPTDIEFKSRCFKHQSWKYENEVRALILTDYNDKDANNSRINVKLSNCLKAIYFGERTEPENIDKIYKIVQDKYKSKSIILYKMLMSTNSNLGMKHIEIKK